MEKKREPFELVIHVDEDGTRATASYRTRIFDDDGVVIPGATTMEAVTLSDLNGEFPWKDFIDPATKAALKKAEATDQLQAELDQEKAKVKAGEAEIEKQKATIADRDALLQAALTDQTQVVNVAVAVRSGLDGAIKARQAKEERET